MSSVPSGYDVLSSHVERVNRAKADLHEDENRAISERERVRREGVKDLAEVNEKARREVAFANRMGEVELAKAKELNLKNIALVNEQAQKKMEELAKHTAEQVAEIERRSFKDIHNFESSKIEKFMEVATKAEDPFYRAKQFSTEIQEEEDFYNVKVKLPPYEAREVSVSGFKNQLRLSFTRSHEVDAVISPTQSNSTRSHEAVTETYYLPTNINFKQVSRSYEDGTLSIRVAKANPLEFQPLRVDGAAKGEKTAKSLNQAISSESPKKNA